MCKTTTPFKLVQGLFGLFFVSVWFSGRSYLKPRWSLSGHVSGPPTHTLLLPAHEEPDRVDPESTWSRPVDTLANVHWVDGSGVKGVNILPVTVDCDNPLHRVRMDRVSSL